MDQKVRFAAQWITILNKCMAIGSTDFSFISERSQGENIILSELAAQTWSSLNENKISSILGRRLKVIPLPKALCNGIKCSHSLSPRWCLFDLCSSRERAPPDLRCCCVRVHALWRRAPAFPQVNGVRERTGQVPCASPAELKWQKWGFADWPGRGCTWQSAFCGWLDALRKKWVQVCGSSPLSLLFVCGLFRLVKMFTAGIIACSI